MKNQFLQLTRVCCVLALGLCVTFYAPPLSADSPKSEVNFYKTDNSALATPGRINDDPGNNSALESIAPVISDYSMGSIGFSYFSPPPPPLNDLCTDAIPLNCGQTVEGSTTEGTIEAVGTCVTVLNTSAGVWYTIQGANNLITATTCAVDGPEFDTKLGVFTGSCGELICVTGNDDSPAGATDLDCTIGTSTLNRASTVQFAAAAGTTYYILVTGFSTNSGDFDLTVTCEEFDCPDILANIGDACDDGNPTTIFDTATAECDCVGTASAPGQVCENALPINSLPFLTNDNTSNYLDVYSGSPGTTCGSTSNYLNGDDVVYSYTAAQAMTVNITMTPTSTSSAVFVYGACEDIGVACLAGVASFANAPKLIEEFSIGAGQTIYIVISTLSAQNMDYTLEIVELATCPPGSDTEGLIIGNPCDDGDPTTLFDTVSEECECIGTPASPGQVCENPLPINSLPFTTTDNTSNYFDIYSGSPGSSGCGSTSSYLNGDDVVYAYTASADIELNLTLTPTGTWSGIFIYDSCEDIGSECLAGVANSTSNVRSIDQFAVANGQTIYIVISTFATPQSVGYTLDISEYFVCPPGSETEGMVVGDPCDDGDPTTLFDAVSEDCECVGTPASPGQICENPLPINSLPFLTTDNTSNYLDIYNGSAGSTGCGSTSSYLNGDDVVYQYTADADKALTLTMTPTGTWSGIFIYDSCEDIGSACLAGVANSGTGVRTIEDFAVSSGQTIYIVISTFALPQSVAYTLEIVEVEVCPPGSETEGLVVGSDCEISGFFDAVVTEDCECVGTPYDCPLLNANIGDPCGTYGSTLADCSCLEVDYCPSFFTNTVDEYISNVNFAGITNPSGSTMYTNFDITFDITAGETSPITVSVTNGSTGTWNESVRVWIDFNQDGTYDPLTEQFNIGTTQSVPAGATVDFTDDIAVPSDALPGVTGMRVTLRFSDYATPCEVPATPTSTTFGEVENYMVNIAASQAATLNGTVTWNAACGDRPTTVSFYEPGTANLVATYNTTVAADGTFSIVDVAEGTFDVFVKVEGQLQKGFGDVSIATGSNNLAVGAVIPGDANNDNGINIDDITIVLDAFGTTTGDPDFNSSADLNCDGDVNIDDLTLVLNNFGQSGDSAPLN